MTSSSCSTASSTSSSWYLAADSFSSSSTSVDSARGVTSKFAPSSSPFHVTACVGSTKRHGRFRGGMAVLFVGGGVHVHAVVGLLGWMACCCCRFGALGWVYLLACWMEECVLGEAEDSLDLKLFFCFVHVFLFFLVAAKFSASPMHRVILLSTSQASLGRASC